MFDKYGNEYVVGLTPNMKIEDGKITNIVPINNIQPKFKKPDFKTIFKNEILHDPNQHRRYFATTEELVRVSDFLNKSREPFDRKRLELQAVNKDDKQYLTLSEETLAYLKQRDMEFVKAVVLYQYIIKTTQDRIDNRPDRYKGNNSDKFDHQQLKECTQHLNEVQQNFKKFVADFTRSLIELEQPLKYEFTDKNGELREVGVGTGNYYAVEIQDMVDSMFGNVTGDDFVEAVNEERYNQKKESNCCLLYEIEHKIYRKKGLPYQQSKQYAVDIRDLEEYKKSPDYIPYTPPSSYKFKEVGPVEFMENLEDFFNFINLVDEVIQSPFLAIASKFKPWVNSKLKGTNWSYDIKNGTPTFSFDNTGGLTEQEKRFRDYFNNM